LTIKEKILQLTWCRKNNTSSFRC